MNINELLVKNYGYKIQPYEDQDFSGFIGQYNELPVSVFGTTEEEVLTDLRIAKEEYFATCIKEGNVNSIPTPKAINEIDYSGRVTARLGKSLHRRVSEYANYDGVSLNQAIQMLIERGLQETHINRFEIKLDKNSAHQEVIAKEIVSMRYNKLGIDKDELKLINGGV